VADISVSLEGFDCQRWTRARPFLNDQWEKEVLLNRESSFHYSYLAPSIVVPGDVFYKAFVKNSVSSHNTNPKPVERGGGGEMERHLIPHHGFDAEFCLRFSE
jgi:hypothetical protein